MANPFGGSGETLEVKGGHANAGELRVALIPRSTSLIKEVVSDGSATQEGGTVGIGVYDANGFAYGNGGSSRWDFAFAGINQTSKITVIAGIKSTGADKNGAAAGARTYRASAPYKQVGVYIEGWGETLYGTVTSDAGTKGTSADNLTVSSSNFYGVAVAHDGVNDVQKWRYVGSNASPPSGSLVSPSMTGADLNSESSTQDTVKFACAPGWGLQYVFVLEDYLSDADIEAIVENPAALVGPVGASFVPAWARGATQLIA